MKKYGGYTPKGYEDSLRLAPKSSIRNVEEIGGDIKNSLRSSKQKRRIRKILKVSERQYNKKFVEDAIEDSQVGYEDEIWDINSYEYQRYILDMENFNNLN